MRMDILAVSYPNVFRAGWPSLVQCSAYSTGFDTTGLYEYGSRCTYLAQLNLLLASTLILY